MTPFEVLLVNDDPVTNQVHAAVLSQAGMQHRFAENGLIAVQACHSQPPDAIVMDIDMPVLNGLDALAELRAAQARHELPCLGVVITSASMTSERHARCMALGAIAVFHKPVDLNAFVDAVRRACRATQDARSDP